MPVAITESSIVANGNGKAIISLTIMDGTLGYNPMEGPSSTSYGSGTDTGDYGPYNYVTYGTTDWYFKRKYETQPDAWLNRPAAKVKDDWSISGPVSPNIVEIRYQSNPHALGYNVSGQAISQLNHTYEIVLDDDLVEGTYTITPPEDTDLAPYDFVYDDMATRCKGIHVNQIGHRPNSSYKKAYYAYYSPSYLEDSYIDLSDYGHGDGETFYILNTTGGINTVAYTGEINLRSGPGDGVLDNETAPQSVSVRPVLKNKLNATGLSIADPAVVTTAAPHGFSTGEIKHLDNFCLGDHRVVPAIGGGGAGTRFHIYVESDTTFSLYKAYVNSGAYCLPNGKSITAVTNTSPCEITTGVVHGLSTGAKILLLNVEGMPSLNNTKQTITVTSTTSFTLDGVDSTSLGTFSGSNPSGFAVSVSTVGSTYSNGQYINGQDSEIYNTELYNWCGTYLYELDFSDWKSAAPAEYKIYIPGLGISDAFTIDEAVHAVNDLHGASRGHYNQQCGIPLEESRGGFERPVNFHDGVGGHEIYWSYLPGIWSSEAEGVGGKSGTPRIFGSNYAGQGINMSDVRATGLRSFHPADAADFDSFNYSHCYSRINQLDLLHEMIPLEVSASIPSAYPPPSEFLEADEWANGDGDDLPGIVRDCALYADWYVQNQQEDGRVPGGATMTSLETDNLPYAVSGANLGGVPSFCTWQQYVYYSADPTSNFMAAGLMAKYAKQLDMRGKTALRDRFITAAEKAWDWAESIYQSHKNGDGSVRDAYFLGYLDLKNKYWAAAQSPVNEVSKLIVSANTSTNVVTLHASYTQTWSIGRKVIVRNGNGTLPTGLDNYGVYYARPITTTTFTLHPTEADAIANTNTVDITATGTGQICCAMNDAEYATMMTSMDSNGDMSVARKIGAGCLMKVLGATATDSNGLKYNDVFTSHAPGDPNLIVQREATAYWEFINTPGADASGWSVGNIETTRQRFLNTANYSYLNTNYYDRLPIGVSPTMRAGNLPAYVARGFILDPSNEHYIKALEAHLTHNNGANQKGECNLTGYGTRYKTQLLHDESRFMGHISPPGYAVYWSDIVGIDYRSGNGMGELLGSDETTSLRYCTRSRGLVESSFGSKKIVEPHLLARPPSEQTLNYHGAIYMSEFTVWDVMDGVQICAAMLHAKDANTENVLKPPRVKFKTKLAA